VKLLRAIILGSGRDYRCQSMCDVTSKTSADEELLLPAAASAATISLIAFSYKRKESV